MKSWTLLTCLTFAVVAGCIDNPPAQAEEVETCWVRPRVNSLANGDDMWFGLRLRLPLIRLAIGPGVNMPPTIQPVQPIYRAPVYQQPYQPQYNYAPQRYYHYQQPVRIKTTPYSY